MNIQIFGRTKCFDTKKAQRWFKERGIRFQFIDLTQKGMSPGEFQSVCRAVGGFEKLADPKAKDAATLQFLALEQDKIDALLNNPALMKTPVVRNGRQATVGFTPDVWQSWE